MAKNTRLKIKIIESQRSQEDVASKIDGLFSSTLSKIINGYQEATNEVKTALANELNCKIEDIF
jgi:DNA-binding XRE family transcriptional regulator